MKMIGPSTAKPGTARVRTRTTGSGAAPCTFAPVPAIRGRGPGALRQVAGRSGAPAAGRGGPSGAALALGEVSFAPALAGVALSSDRRGRHRPAFAWTRKASRTGFCTGNASILSPLGPPIPRLYQRPSH